MRGKRMRSLFFLALLAPPLLQAAPGQEAGHGFSHGQGLRAEREERGYRYPSGEPRDAQRAGLAAAVSEAQRRTGGRVLAAEPREDASGRYYRVKVLTPDGRIQILHIGDR